MTTSTATRTKTPTATSRATTPKGKRAALYARISHDHEGEAQGVERQRVDMRKLAKREGWTVTEYLGDNSRSASRYATKRRPDFDKMMRHVREGLIDVIVVDDMSRYTREARLIEDLIDLAEAGTIEVRNVSGTEYDLRTAEGRMQVRNAAAMNAYYADYISKQVRRKKLALIEEGHSPGGSRAFGYKSRKTTGKRTGTVLEPEEAKAYKQAVIDVLAGASLISIARRWNAQRLYTPRTGSPWGVPSVRATLTNPRHAGILAVSRYKTIKGDDGTITKQRSRRGEVVNERADWPAIITPEQHRRLVALIDAPERRKRNPPRRSLLTGFVRCECGGAMRRDPRYYRCHALPDQPGSCGKVIIAADALDQEITAYVIAKLRNPKIIEKALRKSAQAPSTLGEDPAAILAEIDALDVAVGRGDIPLRSSISIRKDYDARLARARAAQADTDDASALAPFANGNAERIWAALGDDLDRKRTIMRALFDYVTIKPAKTRGYALDVDRISKITWKV